MSFRDVVFGKENAPGRRLTPPGGNNNNNDNDDKSRWKTLGGVQTKTQTDPLLYSTLKLVPSSSCDSSIQTTPTDQQSASLDESTIMSHHSSSSSFGSAGHSITSQESSLSLNSNFNSSPPPRKRISNPQSGSATGMSTRGNPQSGSATSTRGIPGFSTNRRRRNSSFVADVGGGDGGVQGKVIGGWSQRVSKGSARKVEVIHRTGAYNNIINNNNKRLSKKSSPPSSSLPLSSSPSPPNHQRELSTEIKHFQRMVTKLELLIEGSTDSPENQWRSRILVRSAKEADADIADKLYWYEKKLVDQGSSNNCSREARTAQAACMKLHRDYRRAHKALEGTLLEQQRRQQADISTFLQQQQQGATTDDARGLDMLLQKEQEDFFERATREREAEIKQISHKMQQVTDIYQELAALVDDQQEQIDAVEENIYAAKNSVDKGLKDIEYARDRLCVMGDDGYEVPRCGGGMDDDEVQRGGGQPPKPPKGQKDGSGRNSNPSLSCREGTEGFTWSFRTLQKDIFGLGNDLASLGCTFTDNIECGMGNASVFEGGEGSSLNG